MRKIKATWGSFTRNVNTRYHIGMRVVKTALSVFVCMLISFLLDNSNIMHVSAVSAIITMQPSHQDTIRVGAMRVGGTLLGGVVGLLCMLLGQVVPFYAEGMFVLLIPLFMMLDLYICNVLGLQDAAVISCVVVLLIATYVDVALPDILRVAGGRVVDTTIGVVVATGINMLVAPLEARQTEEKRRREEQEDAAPKG